MLLNLTGTSYYWACCLWTFWEKSLVVWIQVLYIIPHTLATSNHWCGVSLMFSLPIFSETTKCCKLKLSMQVKFVMSVYFSSELIDGGLMKIHFKAFSSDCKPKLALRTQVTVSSCLFVKYRLHSVLDKSWKCLNLPKHFHEVVESTGEYLKDASIHEVITKCRIKRRSDFVRHLRDYLLVFCTVFQPCWLGLFVWT